jgi:hypothetical protein
LPHLICFAFLKLIFWRASKRAYCCDGGIGARLKQGVLPRMVPPAISGK